jgi:hypothetical protein
LLAPETFKHDCTFQVGDEVISQKILLDKKIDKLAKLDGSLVFFRTYRQVRTDKWT